MSSHFVYLSLLFPFMFSPTPSHEKLTHKFMHINTHIKLRNFLPSYKKWTLSPCSLRTSMITSLLLPFSYIPFVRHHHLFAHELSEPHDDITYIQPLQIINITTLALLVLKFEKGNHFSKLWYWTSIYIQLGPFILLWIFFWKIILRWRFITNISSITQQFCISWLWHTNALV